MAAPKKGKTQKPDGMAIINEHIANGSFSHAYLITGTERYLIEQYRDKLVNALIDPTDSINFMVFAGDKIKASDVTLFVSEMPFFSDRRVALVKGGGFFKNANKDIEAMLENIPETSYVIFVDNDDNVDGRLKTYKLLTQVGTECFIKTPTEGTLKMWVGSLFQNAGVQVESRAVERLVSNVGFNMNHLANEVEKLISYGLEKGTITIEDVEKLSVNKVVDKIFDLMDAISFRNKQNAITLYNDMLLLGEKPMGVLAMIQRQYNLLLKCKLAMKEGANAAKAASVLGCPAFVAGKLMNQCKQYEYNELIEKMNWCENAESDFKYGAMSDKLAVEMLILNLLQ